MKKYPKTDLVSLYPITLELHREGGYFASCPLFQGCHADGKTMGGAIDNIRDVISVHIEARKKFHELIPSVELPDAVKIRFTLPVPVSG